MLDDIDNVFRVDELRSNNMHLRMQQYKEELKELRMENESIETYFSKLK